MTAESVKTGWGARLAQHRESEDLTQMQLAVRLGCDVTTISRIERGKGSLERFVQVANELGIDLFAEAGE